MVWPWELMSFTCMHIALQYGWHHSGSMHIILFCVVILWSKRFATSNFHPAYVFTALNQRLWHVGRGNRWILHTHFSSACPQNVSVFILAWFLLMPTRGSHSVSLLPLRSMIWFNFFDPNRNSCRSLSSGIFYVFLMRMECAGWIFDFIEGPTKFFVIDWRLLLWMA